MAKHTPGPWMRTPGHFRGDNICVVNCTQADAEDGYTTIAAPEWDHSRDFHEQNAANARLISAAPDLLAACRKIVDAVEDGDEMAAVEMARAAIAKAEVQS